MAKTSWLEKEKRKTATVAKYAALRAELKAKGDYIAAFAASAQCQSGPPEPSLPRQRP
jgi:hypothetical protein